MTHRPLSRRMFGTTALALGVAALAAGCGSGGSTTAPTASTSAGQLGDAKAAGNLKISDPWARVSVQGQPNGAGYFIVENSGEADTLVKAAVGTDIASRAEVHEVVPVGTPPRPGMPASGGMPGMPGMSTTAAGGAMPGMTTTTAHSMPSMPGMTTTAAAAGAAPASTAPAMMMREVPGVDIPAKGKVEFKPGGYHIMLIELKKPIKAGDKIPLTLTFKQAGEVKIELLARER